jgi:hypothetical protein
VKPRRKASVLWGVVGSLSYLVLVQGYELLAGRPVGLVPKAAVAVVVLVVVAVTAHRLRPRLYGNESP